jgi:hypothetical protein
MMRMACVQLQRHLHLLVLNADLLVAVVLVGHNDEVVGAERIDLNGAELASRYLVLEQNVEIGVGETLGRKSQHFARK